MIRMKKYDSNVEMAYLDAVERVVKNHIDRKKIIKSIKKYFPIDVFDDGNDSLDCFQKLILADYETIEKLHKGISKISMQNEVFTKKNKFRKLYQIYHDRYDAMIRTQIGDEKVNVYLVRNNGSYTCPYCNRNYITVRGEKAAGAQLDHFINRKDYPIFALCLYNLVPCCNICNLVKGKNELSISPFNSALDDSYIKFYWKGSLLKNNLSVKIKCKTDIKEDVKILRLREAYDIHKDDLKELLEQHEMYPESQISEIKEMINDKRKKAKKSELTEEDVRDMVFGKQMLYEDYGRKPLAKFRHDILKKLHIYM